MAARIILLMLLITAFPWQPTQAQLPSRTKRQIELTVIALLRRDSLQGTPVDDAITSEMFDLLMASLDDQKLLFTAEEAEKVDSLPSRIVAQLAKGDFSDVDNVVSIWRERRQEQLEYSIEAIDADFNFEKEEQIEMRSEYPSPEELKPLWRQQVKRALLHSTALGVSLDDAKAQLRERYKSDLKRVAAYTADDRAWRYLDALAKAYSAENSYSSPGKTAAFLAAVSQATAGFRAVDRRGHLTVADVVEGGPAEQSGVQPGDRLIAVSQDAGATWIDLIDMPPEVAGLYFRGAPEAEIRLRVYHPVEQKLAILRVRFAQPSTDERASLALIDSPRGGGPIAVITLKAFYMDLAAARRGEKDYLSSTRDVGKLLAEATAKKAQAVVLDLRGNAGGALSEVITLPGLFIKTGAMLQLRTREKNNHYDDLDEQINWDGPLVVLVSRQTTAGGELAAAALQDRARALIVGDAGTRGSATVLTQLELGRQLFRIPNPPAMGGLGVTTGRLFRINGQSPHGQGVTPDIVLPSLSNWSQASDVKRKTDEPIAAVAFEKSRHVTAARTLQLAEAARKRQAANKGFQMEQRIIAYYKTSTAPSAESLQFAKAAKQQYGFARLWAYEFTDHKKVMRDEAVNIASDYAKLLQVK